MSATTSCTAFVTCSAYLCLATAALAQAPVPPEITMQLDDFRVQLTNVAVVVGRPNPAGGPPLDSKPLDAKVLLQPGQIPGVIFDYATEGELPGGARPAVGLQIPPGKNWGYQPTELKEVQGRTGISLFVHPGIQPADFDESLKLVLYQGQKQVESKETIPLKCRVDGIVQLSTSQFEAIRAMGRRLVELEKKVQQLESALAQR